MLSVQALTTSAEISVQKSAPAAALQNSVFDVDGDGKISPFTDGDLILAYEFHLPDSFFAPFVGSTATRTIPQIRTYLDALNANGALDIDGNGNVGAFTDGDLVLGHMFQLSDTMLDPFVAPDATRTTPQISTLLSSLETDPNVPVYDGHYTGSFTGSVSVADTTIDIPGPLVTDNSLDSTIANGNISVTVAGLTSTGTGATDPIGDVNFTTGGTLEGFGVTVEYTGTLVVVGTDVSASGTWTIVNTAGVTGSGTWSAVRDPATPFVSIAATNPSTTEPGGTLPANPGLFTISRTGSTAADLTVNYTIGGTAVNGSDYSGISQSVVIPAGQASTTVTIDALTDETPDPDETVILTVSPSDGYNVNPVHPNATVTILAPIIAPIVSITATDPSAVEPGTAIPAVPGLFTISRSGPTTADLTVNFTHSGTAVNGTDYALISQSVVIPAGQSSVTITINPLTETTADPDETVILSLSTSASYIIDDTQTSATVTITEPTVSAFDGQYEGVFNGSATAFGVKITIPGSVLSDNSIACTISNGVVNISIPGVGASGVGSITLGGAFSASGMGTLQGFGVTVKYTGSLTVSASGISGSGTWSIVNSPHFSGSGTWSINSVN